MTRRRMGFTLIELLVVIAIIGILAAMLFPVFARARESARKTQCLANVKNIAMAYQIYLTDYDRFMPGQHDQRVLDWLADRGGGSCWITVEPNPYLRIPVILDEYTKSREIWLCPSGLVQNNFAINGCLPDWFTWLTTNDSGGPQGRGVQCSRGICMSPYPPGWGGSVTDTATQWQCGGNGMVTGFNSTAGSFATNYASPGTNREKSTSAMGDASKFLVVGECGENAERDTTMNYSYQMCRIGCAASPYNCTVDWVNCSQTKVCGPGDGTFQTDPEVRKTYQYSRPRHMGGMNYGFADGHAKWIPSESALFGGTAGEYHEAGGLFENIQNCYFGPVGSG